jgi:hypothetical protein
MARPRKPKVEPSLPVVNPAATEVPSLKSLLEERTLGAVEPKPEYLIQLLGVAKDPAGQIGVYVVNYDVANNAVVSYEFLAESGQTEAVERFKISAANLFM